MANDDSDRYSKTAKFPKTRPNELSSKQGESGQQIALVANYIKMLAAPKCMFSILFLIFNIFFYIPRGFISISLFVRTKCKFSLNKTK